VKVAFVVEFVQLKSEKTARVMVKGMGRISAWNSL
jgi:hypothetical protein